MQSFPQPLSAAQETVYLRQYQNGDMNARDILIERNLRLVAHIVKKYMNSGKETDEMISVGIVGLVKAVNTYNFEKGSRLATYAARCIDNELLMLMRGDRKLSREVSLYDPIGTDKEGNEIHLMDVIEQQQPDIIDNMELCHRKMKLFRLMESCLSEREKQILILRYGLCQGAEMTQSEIGSRFGISRSYVSRIEKKALQKLREGFEKA